MSNFNFALSATVSADMIKQLVIAEIEKQTVRKVKSIRFTTREVSDYMDRFTSTEFSGAVVEFESPTDLMR